jgi:hypothetical protein
MDPSNTLQLVIEVDALQANSTLRVTREGLVGLERQSMTSGANAAAGMDQFAGGVARVRGESYQARMAAQLLGSEIGVSLPRGVRSFLASTESVGPALQAAFGVGVAVALGIAIFKAGESVYEWVSGTKAAAEAAKEYQKQMDEVSKSVIKVGEELKLYGLTPQAKPAMQSALLGPQIEQAKMQIAALESMKQALMPQATVSEPGWAAQAVEAINTANKSIDLHKAKLKELQDQQTIFLAQAATAGRDEIAKVAEADAKAAADRRAVQVGTYNEIVTAHLDAAKREFDTLKKDNDDQANAEKKAHDDAIASWNEVTAAHVAAADRDVDAIKKEAKAVDDLVTHNATLKESILRGKKDYAGVAQIEIDALDKEKVQYAGNADMIAAIEERKKLLIEQANAEIAKDAQTQFDKTANAIEGFFNRVFLTAKSFADVWKQLWTQAVGYVTSQFAKMAAGMVMGRGGGGYAAAGGSSGGGGGGILGALGGFLPGLSKGGGGSGGFLGTPGFNPNASSPTGGGGSGGILGMLGGGGSGMLGNLKSFFGLGPGGGGGAHLQDTLGSGGQATLGTTLSDIGHSNAALLGGGLLAMNGLMRGGIAGLGETTAGGAMIGYKFGGGLGAAIGAGAGALAGIGRMFIKGSIEKAHDKIKAAYGVDIADKGVLSQIVDIAKQGFGGNLDMAIRSSQVADLVRLYGMSTNQSTGRMAAPMTSSTMIESGGGMSLAPTYYGGNIMGGGLPGAISAGGGGYGSNYTIQLDGPATTRVLNGQVATSINRNPQMVQKAVTMATQQSYNRRQMSALMLSPGTLTS